MFGRVVGLVLLVALTGRCATSVELDVANLGTLNHTESPFEPLEPKDVFFALREANNLAPIYSKIVGPSCQLPLASVSVPARASVTFSSPSFFFPQLCGWQFTTVAESTLHLECRTFNLNAPDLFMVYVNQNSQASFHTYTGQGFPSNLTLNAHSVGVFFLHIQLSNLGSFSCTITASETTTTTTTTTITTTSTNTISASSLNTTTSTTTSALSGSEPLNTTTSTTTSALSGSEPLNTTTSTTTSALSGSEPLNTTTSTTTSALSGSEPLNTTTSTTTSALSGSEPLNTTTSTTTSVPSRDTCRCGVVNRTQRITGGIDTQVNEYAWQVGVLHYLFRFLFCGGSLISDRYIVTSAYCMQGQTISSFRLLLGGHSKISPSATEKIVRPVRIIIHPQYQAINIFDNDIAIVEIAPLDFNDPTIQARPVCLPHSNNTYAGVTATVTGWGTLYSGGPQSDILQEVDLPVVTNNFCTSVYGPYFNSNIMICAGTAAGGKYSCMGDTGGPLIAPDGAKYELIGIVSFGTGCGNPNIPGAYTRVTALQSWIQSTINGSTTCSR